MDFDGPWHGKEGRIPVRRILPDRWCGHAKAVAAAFKAAGYEYIEDQNGEYQDGYFPITISNLNDRRVSAAIGYLDNGTRRRPNLTISAETQVAELLFEGTQMRRRQGAGQGPGDRVPRERGHRLVGRDPFAGASAARRDRPGGGAARSRHRGARQPARRRAAADGPSVGVGVVVHEAGEPPQRPDPPAHPVGAALFVGDRAASRRATCSSRWSANRPGTRSASRSPRSWSASTRRCPRPGRCGCLARLAGRADRRVQPAVRPARPRAADGRVPPVRRDAYARRAAARRSATRSRRATATGCARSASSTTRTGG